MASSAELEFILKMRDEATSVLKKLQDQFDDSSDSAEDMAKSFGKIKSAALDATKAIVGAFTANKLIREMAQEITQVEDKMMALEVATGKTGEALSGLYESIREVGKALSDIPMEQVEQIGQRAAKAGYDASNGIQAMVSSAAKLQDVYKLSDGAVGSFIKLAKQAGLTGGAVEEFANTIGAVARATKGSAEDILDMTVLLKAQTAQFDLSTRQVVALSAAFSKMDLRPMQIAMTFQQTVGALKDASTAGLDKFARQIGMTTAEVKELIASNPAEAFLKLAEAFKKAQDTGGSTDFLTDLGLKGPQVEKVLGNVAQKAKIVRDAITASGGSNTGFLDGIRASDADALGDAFTKLENSFGRITEVLSQAFRPALVVVMQSIANVTTKIAEFVEWMGKSHPLLTQIGVDLGVIGTIAFTVYNAFKLLGTVAPLVAKLIPGLGIIGQALSFIGGLFATVFGAATAPVLGIIAAIAAVGVAILGVYAYWDELVAAWNDATSVGDLFLRIGSIIKQAFYNAIQDVMDMWNEFMGWLTDDESYTSDRSGKSDFAGPRPLSEEAAGPQQTAPGRKSLSENDAKLLEPYGNVKKRLDEINATQMALVELQKLGAEEMNRLGLTSADVARAFEALNKEAAKLKDPMFEVKQQLADQKAAAEAVTAAQKNRLEIEQFIRQETEKRGYLYPWEEQMLRKQLEVIQKIKIANDFDATMRDLQNQIDMTNQVTDAMRQQLEIQQQVDAAKRDKGYSSEQAAQYQQKLEEKLQADRSKTLRDTVKGMQDQIDMMRLSGDNLEAQRQAMTKLKELQDAGLVTEQNRSAVAKDLLDYYKGMEEAAAAQNSGIEGWMRGVKSLKQGLMDAQADFAAALSDGITEAIVGGKMDWDSIIEDLKRKVVKTMVDNALKMAFQGIGFGNESQKPLDSAQKALDNLSKMKVLSTPHATVNAGSVVVTGGAVPGLGGGGLSAIPGLGNLVTPGGSISGADLGIAGVPGGFSQDMIKMGVGATSAPATTDFAPTGSTSSGGGFFTKLGALFGIGAGVGVGGGGSKSSGVSIGGKVNPNQGQTVVVAPQQGGQPSMMPFDPRAGQTWYNDPYMYPNKKGNFTSGQSSSAQNAAGSFSQVFGGGGGGSPQVAPSQMSTPLKSISLSQQEIIDLKKTLATEVVGFKKQGLYDGQAGGIVDTILNRKASGKWGDSITDVVNAKSQFSDINGRPAWNAGRNSVSDLPDSMLLKGRGLRASNFVDQYLPQRAGGMPSSVGDHLNYANPYYADARNRSWINKLDGPQFGAGKAIHMHGTTPDLQRFRPGQYGIQLPQGMGPIPTPTSAPINPLGSGSPMLAQFSQDFTKQMNAANTVVANQMPKAFESPFAKIGQSFGSLFGGGSGGGGGGIGGIFSSLFGGGGGGGLGGLFSMLQPLLGLFGMFHDGGTVGAGGTPTIRAVSKTAMMNANRYHSGLGIKSDEMLAILQKGEKVIPREKVRDMERQAFQTRNSPMTYERNHGGQDGAPYSSGMNEKYRKNVVIKQTIIAPDPGAFNEALPNMARKTYSVFDRANRRNG